MIMLDLDELGVSEMTDDELEKSIYILEYRIRRITITLKSCTVMLEKLKTDEKRRLEIGNVKL